MKRRVMIVLAAFTVLTMPMAAAQSQSSNANPSLVTPNSPLYGLETAWDNAAVNIGLKKASSVAEERVAEAETMSARNNTKGTEKAAKQFGRMAERSLERNETDIGQSIQRMEQVIEDAPNEQAKQGMEKALENMREAQERRKNAGENSYNQGKPEKNITPKEPLIPDNDEQTPENPEEEQQENTREQTSSTERTSGTGDFELLVSDQPY